MTEDENIKILKTRYAKGEITKKEFLEMKDELKEDNQKKENSDKTDKSSNKRGGGGLIALIILILIVFAVLYLLSTGALSSLFSGAVTHTSGITNPVVTVSGYVKTTTGTSPITVSFGGSTTPVNSGYYSTSLQNDQQYSISVSYSGLTGTQSCNAGTLNLQSSTSSINYNVSC